MDISIQAVQFRVETRSKVILGLGDLATALSWPVVRGLRLSYASPCTEIELSVSQGQQLTHRFTGAMLALVAEGQGLQAATAQTAGSMSIRR